MTCKLAESDLQALRAVADWTNNFVAKPNKDLGRAGTVCPFVPGALEHDTLWLTPEPIADRSVADIVQLVNDYKAMLLRARPVEGDDIAYKAIVVVFTGTPADRVKEFFDEEQVARLTAPSYADDGVVIGQFHELNDGSAIYNDNFHPFRSPVPFLLLRHAHITDWKFFLDNEEWFGIWARRFGESAPTELGHVLNRTNWRKLNS